MSNGKQAVVIGASAGALEALFAILPMLPASYPLAVLVVVHVPAGKPSLLPSLLQAKCKLTVVEAEDKMPIRPGTIYFAPPDYHLLVETDLRIALSGEEEVQFSRPSIDVLFETAADAYGQTLIGVVLTGANSDGALGLKAIVAAGGDALVQQPQTAYASAMPQAAHKSCPHAPLLTLADIGTYLAEAA